MSHAVQVKPVIRLVPLLALAITVTAASLTQADPSPEPQALQKARADCRLEGEAGGISGIELEDFIDQCVADLLSVEILNIQGE